MTRTTTKSLAKEISEIFYLRILDVERTACTLLRLWFRIICENWFLIGHVTSTMNHDFDLICIINNYFTGSRDTTNSSELAAGFPNTNLNPSRPEPVWLMILTWASPKRSSPNCKSLHQWSSWFHTSVNLQVSIFSRVKHVISNVNT